MDGNLFEAAAEPGATFIRDLADGQLVDGVFAVRERERRTKRDGGDWVRLVLADRTGRAEAAVWDGVEECFAAAEPGKVVRVAGRFRVDARWGAKITVSSLRRATDGEYRAEDITEGPAHPVDQMEADLRELVATVQSPYLRQLLDRLLGEGSPVWTRFREAPAAKFYHQAYPHGLLEHALSVAQGVSAVSAAFGGVDRDVAVSGALLHDIGKTQAYNDDPMAIDLTDAGRLQGEIPLGYYLVRREIEAIEGFPADLAQALLHIVLSHHGTLEHGSPVMPCTREAALVHAIDNLGGKLGSFDRLEKGLRDGESWSGFDKAISGSAYFPAAQSEAA